VLSFGATKSILAATGTQNIFRACHLCLCNFLTETNNAGLGAIILSCLLSELQKAFSPGQEPRTFFRVFYLCSCNLLIETNNAALGLVLLLTFRGIKQTGLEPRTVCRCCGLSSCNLSVEANNFRLGAVLLSCLVSEL
jgi:hypothetical protein